MELLRQAKEVEKISTSSYSAPTSTTTTQQTQVSTTPFVNSTPKSVESQKKEPSKVWRALNNLNNKWTENRFK